MRGFSVICLSIVLAACTAGGSDNTAAVPAETIGGGNSTPAVEPTSANAAITALDCAQLTRHFHDEATCVAVPPDAVLLQAKEDTQLTLQTESISITFSVLTQGKI